MIILDTRKNAIVGCTDYQLPVTRLGEAQGRRRYDISTGFRGLWALKSGFRGLWAFKRFGRFVGVKGSVVLGGLWALEGV